MPTPSTSIVICSPLFDFVDTFSIRVPLITLIDIVYLLFSFSSYLPLSSICLTGA